MAMNSVHGSIRPIQLLVMALTVLLIGGCASLSKNECINADWQLIGYEDGVSAQPADRIGNHRKACAKHDVIPDKGDYDVGYAEGIYDYCSESRGFADGNRGSRINGFCPTDTEYHIGYSDGVIAYCTYERGYGEGLNGREYRQVCPQDLEPAFLQGYEEGLHIHALQDELRGLEKRHYALARRQESNLDEMDELRRRVAYEEELSGDQRAALLDEVDDLAADNVAIERELVEIEAALHDVEDALNQLTGDDY